LSILEIVEIQNWFREHLSLDMLEDFFTFNYDKYFESVDEIILFEKDYSFKPKQRDMAFVVRDYIYRGKINELLKSDNIALKMIGEDMLLFYNHFKDKFQKSK